jgi:hypothetical protein
MEAAGKIALTQKILDILCGWRASNSAHHENRRFYETK